MSIPIQLSDKQKKELAFWDNEITRYAEWMEGTRPKLYNTPSPYTTERVSSDTQEHAAVLTWLKLHQMPKYLADLQLPADAFKGLNVLDVGSGPMPSACAFHDCHITALDPLHPYYQILGFPYGKYHAMFGEKLTFATASAETMPFGDNSFDVVISVNAIDHVDQFEKTAQEIKRVLKPNGKLAIHIHHHTATICEPIELTESRVKEAFSSINGLHIINSSQTAYSSKRLPKTEHFTLWRNF